MYLNFFAILHLCVIASRSRTEQLKCRKHLRTTPPNSGINIKDDIAVHRREEKLTRLVHLFTDLFSGVVCVSV